MSPASSGSACRDRCCLRQCPCQQLRLVPVTIPHEPNVCSVLTSTNPTDSSNSINSRPEYCCPSVHNSMTIAMSVERSGPDLPGSSRSSWMMILPPGGSEAKLFSVKKRHF